MKMQMLQLSPGSPVSFCVPFSFGPATEPSCPELKSSCDHGPNHNNNVWKLDSGARKGYIGPNRLIVIQNKESQSVQV